MRQRTRWTILLASVAYVVVGIGTSMLAGAAVSRTGVQAWRLAAWLLSLVVFGVHLASEHRRQAGRVTTAARVALAVALGAFGLAALGPVRSHWSDPHLMKIAVLSLAAWPVVTGVPAFMVALIIGFFLDRGEEAHQQR